MDQNNILPYRSRSARLNKDQNSENPTDDQPKATCSTSRSSASTRSSATTKRRLVEAQAARQLAELEERRLAAEQQLMEQNRELIERRLAVERTTIEARLEEEKAQIDMEEEEKAGSSRRSSHTHVERWLDNNLTGDQVRSNDAIKTAAVQLEKVTTTASEYHHGVKQSKPDGQDRRYDDMANLTTAITDAIRMASTSANHPPPATAPLPAGDKLLGRLSAKDLPTFSGDPLDWLRFKHAFETTTKIGQFSKEENVARLQRCLRGEAWEAVAARVITVSSADEIMKTLEMRFGMPELILHKIMNEIKKIPKLCGSRSGLVALATKVSNCVAAITATNYVDYLYSPELVSEIVSKLTENLVYRWIDYSATQDATHRPRLAALSDYLMREAELVCRAGVMEMPLKSRTVPSGINRQSVLVTAEEGLCFSASTATNEASVNAISFQKLKGSTDAKPHCLYCSTDSHELGSCVPFSSLTIDERWNWICNKKLCFKCFSEKHRRERCRSKKQCKTCNRGHHTLLHREDWVNWTKSKPNDDDTKPPPETTANVWSQPEQKGRIYLKVLPVTVIGPAGSINTCALLDGGSTVSLIDCHLAEQVGAEGFNETLEVQGAMGEKNTEDDSRTVSVMIRTSEGSFSLPRLRTVSSLKLPTQKIDKSIVNSYSHLQGVPLHEYEGQPKLLIGLDYRQLIASRELIERRMNEPAASRTMLGWVLYGFVSSACKVNTEFSNHLHHSEADAELHDLVKDYFRVDSIGVKHEDHNKFSPDEQRAMNILDTKSRKIGNRWETGLLWRSDDVTLPDNKKSAMKRLMIVEKMMDADPAFAADYSKQVDNLLEKDYAEEVREPVFGKRVWHLAHFGVRNPNKPGKLRQVHDAKAETKGISLNTELLAGPDLLNSLVGVLLRFRERAVAVTGDIREMFMRVKINEEDQKSQLFLWRGMNRDGPPRTYKMTSMIFGAKSSPCTATYIIRRNADEYADSHPRAVMAIKERHYVDDYCDSVDSIEEMKQLVADVTSIHLAGGFEIRGFVSNKPECLPEQTETASVSLLQTESAQRTLGMIWKPMKDVLGFDLSFKKLNAEIVNGSRKPTKREMLKVIMSVFDPLGFLSPFLIRGKILLQQLWRSGVQWDELIGDAFARTWSEFLQDLKSCQEFCVPRCYGFSVLDSFQMHVFVDASEQAYAAVAYLRRSNGEVAFVAAKCRVAPLKLTTVPRLELQAALMGTRLGSTIQKEQALNIEKRYFWTDSRVAWHWIQNNPQEKKSFVFNRLSEIRDLSSPTEWKWLPGELNVADEATRAKQHDITQLKWIKGPDFLQLTEDQWPKITPPTILEEMEYTLVTHNETIPLPLPDLRRFSKWLRLIRATAYVSLFIERLRTKTRISLQSRHLDHAEQLWIRQSQQESFGEELARLKAKQPITKSSRLKNLHSYIDGSGVLRLRGRARAIQDVERSMLDPVLLDGRNQYTRLLVRHFHENTFHGNTETIVNDLRQRYWVIHLRPTVKAIEHSCLFCRIRKTKPLQPPTGDLPLARLAHHTRAFTHCGLDYFGPMTVTIGRRHEKRYGVLFTCMTTRGVHLELAGSLTTDSTIMALRRMMCRRGCPKVIYSDNGTNFRGANTELKKVLREVDQDEISNFLTNKRIEWRFNPPLAPHMGGCWERLVRSVKTSLKTVLNEQAPKEETLVTLLTEVEHTVNSRPLTHVSVSESDPESLTPNHFLLGGPSYVPWLGNSELVTRKCWRNAQRLADAFWKRWLREYLPTLVPRSSRVQDCALREGSVVLVADPSLPRNIWPKGVVVKVFPGPDGVCRVADIKTVGGILRRPYTKIINLDNYP